MVRNFPYICPGICPGCWGLGTLSSVFKGVPLSRGGPGRGKDSLGGLLWGTGGKTVWGSNPGPLGVKKAPPRFLEPLGPRGGISWFSPRGFLPGGFIFPG